MPGSTKLTNGFAANPVITLKATDDTPKDSHLATKDTRDGLEKFSGALIGILRELWDREVETPLQPDTRARDQAEAWNRSARISNAALDKSSTVLRPLVSVAYTSVGKAITGFPTTIAELESLPYKTPKLVCIILRLLGIHPFPERFNAEHARAVEDLTEDLDHGDINLPSIFSEEVMTAIEKWRTPNTDIKITELKDVLGTSGDEVVAAMDRLKRQLRVAVGLLPRAISVEAVHVEAINIV